MCSPGFVWLAAATLSGPRHLNEVDTQSPSVESSGFPLATGRLTVEQEIASLCRQARVFAGQFGIRTQDIRGLSLAIYETTRRLREAGARGHAELCVADGPSLRVVVRALASPGVLEDIQDSILDLSSIVGDLSIFPAKDGLTVRVSIPVPSGSPELPQDLPGYEPNGRGLATPGDAGSKVDTQELAPTDPAGPAGFEDLRAELDDVNRGLVALYQELANRTGELHESVAQRRELEKELHRRAGALAAANRAVEDFLSTLSHELRTPLNAMLGWTRLLRTGHLDETASERALETIERNAHLQEKLISDILDASRIVTGQLALDLRPVGLASLLKQTVESLKPAAEAKGITFETAVRFRGRVRADAGRLRQVVRNLLENAIKFTPAEGHIRLSLERTGDNVALTVADTGQGIAQEFLPFIFDRFRQGDTSATRSHGGLGLGLSIVEHIVRLHGGRVQVASEGPGLGASFSVLLPVGV